MKVLGVLIAFVLLAIAMLALAAYPTMLVLGWLHDSGMEYIPPLGFWQTLGSLYLISAVGGAFHSSALAKND